MENLATSASEFDQFFKTLAGRLRKETHLSDITYTAIELIPEFKKDFIRYFFEHLNADEEIEVIREFPLPSADGQPDFVFRAESWDLIVENKIWDRKYHFDQYGKAPLKPGKLVYVGLIANHAVPIPSASTWQFRQWDDFVDKFGKKNYGRFHPVFVAYLNYVKEICTMAEFENFTFDPKSLFALTHFVRMAERALRTTSSASYEIVIKPNQKWNFGDSWAGHWFDLKPADPKKTLNLFFGVDFSYERESPAITVDVHEPENPICFNAIKKASLKSSFFEKIFRKENETVQLHMPAERFNSVSADLSKENQLNALRSFLKASCDALLKSIG